jgi:hypothetical protein
LVLNAVIVDVIGCFPFDTFERGNVMSIRKHQLLLLGASALLGLALAAGPALAPTKAAPQVQVLKAEAGTTQPAA